MNQKFDYHGTKILLDSLGIAPDSFERFVCWALAEHLVSVLVNIQEIKNDGFFARLDALKRFQSILTDRTSRKWSTHDLHALFNRVKNDITNHERMPVQYGEYLKLLWQVPWQCALCHRSPPEVKLHIDHIIPVSRGGSSRRSNLQFLCRDHNLSKSNQREVSELWLDLR